MTFKAALMRGLNEFLSSKVGNSLLPRGTSSPFSDLISTTTVSAVVMYGTERTNSAEIATPHLSQI